MFSEGTHVKFVCLVLLAISEEAETLLLFYSIQ